MASTRLGRLSAVARRAAALLAVDARLRTRDRRTLETILRYYAREPSDAPVLFVGCAWYTRRYARLFSDDAYITLDVDPAKARFGASRHIVASLESVGTYFENGELRTIICNGVFGWGLNARENVIRAFEACSRCLTAGGHLVLGWNDVEERRPFHPHEAVAALDFERFNFPPFGVAEYQVAGALRHTFSFYRTKPGG